MSSSDATASWERYQFPTTFVLGFHGCDRSVGEGILSEGVPHLLPSKNDYDWLGTGIYFWQSNPLRAMQFARERAEGARNSRIYCHAPGEVEVGRYEGHWPGGSARQP